MMNSTDSLDSSAAKTGHVDGSISSSDLNADLASPAASSELETNSAAVSQELPIQLPAYQRNSSSISVGHQQSILQ